MADANASEMTYEAEVTYALLAEFDQPEQLVDGVRHLKEAGYRVIDAFSPFPVVGLAEAMEFTDRRVPLLTLAGGIIGAVLGFALQAYANLAFPIQIGGRPLVAWQAFMLITFELMVLSAVLFSVGGMFFLNGLPRLHHPLFEAPNFSFAGGDRFFIAVFSKDRLFDLPRTREFLENLHPRHLNVVTESEVMSGPEVPR